MIGYALLAIVKVFDNVISTAKNIAQYKEQKFLSSFLTIVSQLMFYLVISKVIEDNAFKSIVIVSVASGIGNYVAFVLNDRFKCDDKWWIYITTSDMNFMQELCKYLSSNKIKYSALNGFDRKGNHSIHVIIFSKTKDESRIARAFLNNSNKKYLIEIMK